MTVVSYDDNGEHSQVLISHAPCLSTRHGCASADECLIFRTSAGVEIVLTSSPSFPPILYTTGMRTTANFVV